MDRSSRSAAGAGLDLLAHVGRPWHSAVSHLLRDAILHAFESLHMAVPQMSSQSLLAIVRDFERELMHFEVSWQSDPGRCAQCAQHVQIVFTELGNGQRCLVPVTPSVELPVAVHSLRLPVVRQDDEQCMDVAMAVNWPNEFAPFAATISKILSNWDASADSSPHVGLWELFRHAVGSGGKVLRWSLGEVQRFGRFVFREHGLPPPRCPNEVWYQLFRQCDGSALTTLDFGGALSFARHLLATVLSFHCNPAGHGHSLPTSSFMERHRPLMVEQELVLDPLNRAPRNESSISALRVAAHTAAMRSAAAAAAAAGVLQPQSLRPQAKPTLSPRSSGRPLTPMTMAPSATLPELSPRSQALSPLPRLSAVTPATGAVTAPELSAAAAAAAVPPLLHLQSAVAGTAAVPTSPPRGEASLTSLEGHTLVEPTLAPTAQLLPMPAFRTSMPAADVESRSPNTLSELDDKSDEGRQQGEDDSNDLRMQASADDAVYQSTRPNIFSDETVAALEASLTRIETQLSDTQASLQQDTSSIHDAMGDIQRGQADLEHRMEAAVQALNKHHEVVSEIKDGFFEHTGSQRAVDQEVATLHASMGFMQDHMVCLGKAMSQLAAKQTELAQVDPSHNPLTQRIEMTVTSIDDRLSSLQACIEGKASKEQMDSSLADIQEHLESVRDESAQAALKNDVEIFADRVHDQINGIHQAFQESSSASSAEVSILHSQVISVRERLLSQLADMQDAISGKIDEQQLDASVGELHMQLTKACAALDEKASKQHLEAAVESIQEDQKHVQILLEEKISSSEANASSFENELACIRKNIDDHLSDLQSSISTKASKDDLAAAQPDFDGKASVEQLESAVDVVKELLQCAQLELDQKTSASEARVASLQQQMLCIRDTISAQLSGIQDAVFSKKGVQQNPLLQELVTEVNDVKEQLRLAQQSSQLKASASEAEASRVQDHLRCICSCINDQISCLQDALSTKVCKQELAASMLNFHQEIAAVRGECVEKASLHQLESKVTGLSEQLRCEQFKADQRASMSEARATSVEQQLLCIRDSINDQLSGLQTAIEGKADQQQVSDSSAKLLERFEAAHEEWLQKPSMQQLDDAVGSFEEQLKSLWNSLDRTTSASDAEISDLRGQMNCVRDNVDMQFAELQNAIGSKATKQELMFSIASVEEEVAAARADWCLATGSAKELKDAVGKMREQVRNVHQSFDEKVSELETKASSVQDQLISIRDSIQHGESAIHWNINSMQATQAGLEEQVETAISTIQNQLGVINDIQGTIDEFTGSQRAVNKEMEELEASMSSMQAHVRSMHTTMGHQLADLRSTVNNKAGRQQLESCKARVEELLESAQSESDQQKSVKQLEVAVDSVKEEVRRAQLLFDEKVSALETKTSSVQDELISLCDDLQKGRSQSSQPHDRGTTHDDLSEQNAVWPHVGHALDTSRLSLISSSLEALQAELAADVQRQEQRSDTIATNFDGGPAVATAMEDASALLPPAGMTAAAGKPYHALLAEAESDGHGEAELAQVVSHNWRWVQDSWLPCASQCKRTEWFSLASPAPQGSEVSRYSSPDRGGDFTSQWIAGAITLSAADEAPGTGPHLAASSGESSRRSTAAICEASVGATCCETPKLQTTSTAAVAQAAAAAQEAINEAEAAENECSFFGGVLGQLRALETWVDDMRCQDEHPVSGIHGKRASSSVGASHSRDLRTRLTAGRALSALCEALPTPQTPSPLPARIGNAAEGATRDSESWTPAPQPFSRSRHRKHAGKESTSTRTSLSSLEAAPASAWAWPEMNNVVVDLKAHSGAGAARATELHWCSTPMPTV